MSDWSTGVRLGLWALWLWALPVAAQEPPPVDLAGTLAGAAEQREAGQWQSAEQLLRQALKQAPYSPALGLALAETMLAGSRQLQDSGVQHLGATVRLAPGSAEAQRAAERLNALGEAALAEPPGQSEPLRGGKPPGVSEPPPSPPPEPVSAVAPATSAPTVWPGAAGLVRRGLDLLTRLCRLCGRWAPTFALLLFVGLLPLGWVVLGWVAAHAGGRGSGGPFDLSLEGEEQLLTTVGFATLLLALPFVLWFTCTAPAQDFLGQLRWFGVPLSEHSGALSLGSGLAMLLSAIALGAMVDSAISEPGMTAAAVVAAGVALAQVCYWRWSAGSLLVMDLLLFDTLLCLALSTAISGWAQYDAEELGAGATVVLLATLLLPGLTYGVAHLARG